MKAKYTYFILALTIAVSLVIGGCGSGGGGTSNGNQNVTVNPNPVIPPVDLVEKALISGLYATETTTEKCENSFVIEKVSKLCELFALVSGGDACVSQTSSCNSYQRQIYTGSDLGLANTTNKAWNGRGGSGPLMADAALCTLRELSPKVPGGGPLLSERSLNIGIGDVKVEQEVGYINFERDNARFKGYRKLRVEIPVLGKFDAITQNIDFRKVYYGSLQLFDEQRYAGDYPLLYGYGLNLSSEEKSKFLDIKPPAFNVTTPIGVFEAQPDFCYKSNTVVADTPLVTDHTYIPLPNDDYDNSPAAIKLADLYGVIPGVGNNATPPPSVSPFEDYKSKRTGWISQVGLGTRGSGSGSDPCKGSGSDKLWSYPKSGFFSRPDYYPFGVSDFDFKSYEGRSDEENRPSVYARASASLKYPKDPSELLPGWVFGLPGLDWDAYIKVTPTIEFGAAGQFGLGVAEGTDYGNNKTTEFGKPYLKGRSSALGIYSGVEVDASFEVLAELKIFVSADYWFDTVELIDINPKFPIPLAGDHLYSDVKLASALSASSSSKPDLPETLDSLWTFTGQKPDPGDFIYQCYAKEKEIPEEKPPDSEPEKGNPEDLFEFLPCNICMATDAVIDPKTGEIIEPAHQDILGQVEPTPPAVWECDAHAKSGCMDLCKLNKETGEFTVVKNPSEIADSLPTTDPDYNKLYPFYKSCMISCDEVTPLPAFGDFFTACKKGLDAGPPKIVATNTGSIAGPFPANAGITASFSEPMEDTSINETTFLVRDSDGINLSGSVTYNPDTRTATFTPRDVLAYSTTYTATITSGVTDIGRNPLAEDYSWSFTTEAVPDSIPPVVTLTNPSQGEADVPVTSTISVTFSESIDPVTITSSSFFISDGRDNVSGAMILTDDGKTVIFDPSADLAAGTAYTVTLTTGIKDLAGNALAEDNIWSFTTAPVAVGGGRIVFITSTVGNGNLSTWLEATRTSSGIAAGDTICKARATSAGLSNASNFKAWLSDSTTDAIDRIVSDGPWFRPDGEKVADNKADLTNGNINAVISQTETGEYLSTNVWTGTGRDGLLSIGANTCEGWTSSVDINSGAIGDSASFDGRWSYTSDSLCSNSHSLYCFED